MTRLDPEADQALMRERRAWAWEFARVSQEERSRHAGFLLAEAREQGGHDDRG